MGSKVGGKARTVAESVKPGRSLRRRQLNCLKFDELMRLLGNRDVVWKALRAADRAADMRRSLYHVHVINQGVSRQPQGARSTIAA